MSSTRREQGFTLVEVVLVLALLVPMLVVIASVSKAALGSVASNDRAATSTELELRCLARVERALRYGGRESLVTPATREDVRLGRAENEGDWTSLPSGEPRTEIAVAALIGDDGLELQIPRRTHRLVFVLDDGETADGADNDGDGMVDEGSVWFGRGDDMLRVVEDVEQCAFELDGSAVEITLRVVRPGHGQGLQRRTLRHTVHMLNP